MNVRLFEMISTRMSVSLFESGIALVFFIGLLVALIYRPQRINNVPLLRMSCFLFVLAMVIPGLTESIVYRNCQLADIRLKETESINITVTERSGTRSNDSESSLTGLDPVAYIPLGQVAGNILLALSVYCGVVALCPKKVEARPEKVSLEEQVIWPADAESSEDPSTP